MASLKMKSYFVYYMIRTYQFGSLFVFSNLFWSSMKLKNKVGDRHGKFTLKLINILQQQTTLEGKI